MGFEEPDQKFLLRGYNMHKEKHALVLVIQDPKAYKSQQIDYKREREPWKVFNASSL